MTPGAILKACHAELNLNESFQVINRTHRTEKNQRTMTPAQRKSHKLGNAIRAFRGVKYTNGKWRRPPQKNAVNRISRWLFRCRRAGIISSQTESIIRAQIPGIPTY